MLSALSGLPLLAMAQAGSSPPPPAPPPPSERAGSSPPAGPPRLIGNDDYPASALRNDDEGVVGFRLSIDATGRVSGCTILQSSGAASLDSATCRLLTARARFTPARDANGEPVPDTVSARIVWRIASNPEPFSFLPTVILDTIRAAGKGRTTCWRQVDTRHRHSALCPEDVAAWLSSKADSASETLEMTIVTTLTPAGQAEPSWSAGQGDPLQDIEASLGIAEDGSVLDCRIVRRSIAPSAAAMPVGLCGSFAPGGPRTFRAAADGEARRTASVRVRTFVAPLREGPQL